MREEPPAAAAARMAEIRAGGTWDSALTSGEFAAIRSVGFEPVGQVFGAAVYGTGYANGYSCPGTGTPSREAMPPQAAARVQPGSPGPFGPLVRAMDQARHTAIERMAAECSEAGGDGVVGVRLTSGPFPLGGQEFTVIGTAVAARGAERPRQAPFTSSLSGQDFARLIMAGWVPAGLVLGLSMGARHDDRQTVRQTRRWSGNAEVDGWTELVSRSRREARSRLEGDVERLGAEGVVITSMQMLVRERDCPAQTGRRDHTVEATLLGTAIARFYPTGHNPGGPAVTVMTVDPDRGKTRSARQVVAHFRMP